MFSVQTVNTFPFKSGIQALMSPDLQRSWSSSSLQLSRSALIDIEILLTKVGESLQSVVRTNDIGHSFPFSPVHENSCYIYGVELRAGRTLLVFSSPRLMWTPSVIIKMPREMSIIRLVSLMIGWSCFSWIVVNNHNYQKYENPKLQWIQYSFSIS